jgi:phage tail sheath gpL-like
MKEKKAMAEIIQMNIPETMIPGSYMEFNWYAGPNGLPQNIQKILLIGDATGTLAVNKPTAVYTEQEKTTLAGDGSVLGQMYDSAKKAWKYSQISILRHAAPSGFKATWEIALGYNTADAESVALSGLINVTIGNTIVPVSVFAGDALEEVATAIVAEINAITNLPVTASAEGDVVTLTAKNMGKYISDGVQVSAAVVSSDVTTVITVTAGVGTVNIEEALKSAFAERYHLIAISVNDSANLLLLRDHLERAAGPLEQRGQRGITTAVVTGVTDALTLASPINHERVHVMALKGSVASAPWEVSAGAAAIFCSSSKPNVPLDGLPIPGLATPDTINKWSGEEQDALMYGGSIPLVEVDGQLTIVRAVTTRTNMGGARFTKLIDTGIIASADYVRDAIVAMHKIKYTRKVIHSMLLIALNEDNIATCEALEAEQILRNIADYADQFITQESTNAPGRALCRIPAPIVPGLHQIYSNLDIYV